MAKIFLSNLTISAAPANPTISTQQLFEANHEESIDSPIDQFLLRIYDINKRSPRPDSFDSLLGQLILLGVIAAVESYFRTLFRRLIIQDNVCQESVYKREVSFGAALHLSKDMLPEAILERISFISKSNIESALRELLAVKGALPADLEAAISDYGRICHLRHCAVHRFGKLGANNAIELGLDDHKGLLEKPLKLDYTALQSAIAISVGLVKTLNNYLFNVMLSRLPSATWTGLYKEDAKTFKKYYSIFADEVSVTKSISAKDLYAQFQTERSSFVA